MSVETYRKSYQRFLYFLQMPMSINKLSTFSIGSLRSIAKLFKAYNGSEMRDFKQPDLIRFICGYQDQPDQYHPIEKLPGIDYPEIEDQKYRQMFAAKVDPWKRHGKD